MTSPAPPAKPRASRSIGSVLVVGVPVALGWLWSMALLHQRVHMVWVYAVFPGASGLGDWLKALLIVFVPTLFWVTFLAAGVGWMWACIRPAGWRGRAGSVLLVVGFWVIPVMELLRLVWPGLPMTFLEPIGLAFLTGMVVRRFVRQRVPAEPSPGPARPLARRTVWFPLVVMAAAAMGGWWFWVSHRAYADYQLGYFDFGHFARRVINT